MQRTIAPGVHMWSVWHRSYPDRAFGAKIATRAVEAPLLPGPVDRTLEDGDVFFGASAIAPCG